MVIDYLLLSRCHYYVCCSLAEFGSDFRALMLQDTCQDSSYWCLKEPDFTHSYDVKGQ
jgi:hypothetical protein